MNRFPRDAPKDRVVRALEELGFVIVRVGAHVAMLRQNPDGSRTPLTMPNHSRIKGSTLRTILRQGGIDREEFQRAFDAS